jgi:hypothetical protein
MNYIMFFVGIFDLQQFRCLFVNVSLLRVGNFHIFISIEIE